MQQPVGDKDRKCPQAGARVGIAMINRQKHAVFSRTANGNCPQCLLAGRTVEMRLNHDDLWACPECGLQAHSASSGMFAIMKQRNKSGLTATGARSRVAGCVLTKVHPAEWFRADSSGFASEAELREFLTKNVAKPIPKPRRAKC